MKKVLRVVSFIMGIILVILGGGLLYGHFTHPEETQKIVENSKSEIIDKPVSKFKEKQLGILPSIKFDGSGGMPELDNADWGSFILIEDYLQVPDLLPVYAAHNSRGGKVILEWDVGQHINISGDGYDGEYVVVDDLIVNRYKGIKQILSLQGEVALQTCVWGSPTMRFIGLVPVNVYNNDWPPSDEEIAKIEEIKNNKNFNNNNVNLSEVDFVADENK